MEQDAKSMLAEAESKKAEAYALDPKLKASRNAIMVPKKSTKIVSVEL